jgi:hypothetical protein
MPSPTLTRTFIRRTGSAFGRSYAHPVQPIPITVIPDPDTPGCADIKIDITVAGRPYRCELDTGAARTTLVADEYLASLPVTSREGSSGAFAAKDDDLVTIPGLTAGPLSAGPLDVARIEAGPHRSSVLGMDVLGRHCLRFRFDAGVLELIESPSADADLPLTVGDRGHPYVEFSWDGVGAGREVLASACWDSGSGITLVDAAFQRAHPDLFTPAGTTPGTDSTGTRIEETPVCLMAGPVIGGVPFGSSLVAVIDMEPMNRGLANPMEVIAGYPTYRQADWLFDVPARRWAAPRLLAVR